METVSQKLTRIRKEAGLSQKELARLLRRSNSYISRIESGEREPTPALVHNWLKACRPKTGWTEQEYQLFLSELQGYLATQSKNRTELENEGQNRIVSGDGDYAGNYHIYNFPTTGEDRLVSLELRIDRTSSGFPAYLKNPSFGTEYTGELLTSEQNIYIDVVGINIARKILYTFYNPPTRKIHKLWGILSGPSLFGEPIAIVVLLSKDPLNEQNVREEFERLGYNYHNSVLKIPRDARVFVDNLETQ